MPLRVISYDGSAYRSQLDENKGRYPVITLVLYYGKQNWDAPTSLSGLMDIPEEIKPYFNDYKINLISVKDMKKEQINKFISDLKIYFDYVKGTLNDEKDYDFPNIVMQHPDAVALAMNAFSDDNDIQIAYIKSKKKQKGGKIAVCDIASEIKKRGKAEGRVEGKAENTAEIIINMLKNNLTDELIKNVTNTSQELIDELKKKLDK